MGGQSSELEKLWMYVTVVVVVVVAAGDAETSRRGGGRAPEWARQAFPLEQLIPQGASRQVSSSLIS